MHRLVLLFIITLALSSCGYRFDGGEKITVSVPYVQGDFEGELTDALVSALSHTSQFRYTQGQGDWTLKAKILNTDNQRIGFRYDRRPDKEGQRRKNIVGVENRKEISIEVKVVNSTTDALVWGPHIVKADATYDYVDPNALQDVAVVNLGTDVPSVSYSLGQLDEVAAAGEDAIYPIYRRLARRVVEGLIIAGDPNF